MGNPLANTKDQGSGLAPAVFRGMMPFTLELQLGNMMPMQQILAGFHERLAVCAVSCILC